MKHLFKMFCILCILLFRDKFRFREVFLFIALSIFDGKKGGGVKASVIKPHLQPQSHYYSQWQVDHNIITAGRMVDTHG